MQKYQSTVYLFRSESECVLYSKYGISNCPHDVAFKNYHYHRILIARRLSYVCSEINVSMLCNGYQALKEIDIKSEECIGTKVVRITCHWN